MYQLTRTKYFAVFNFRWERLSTKFFFNDENFRIYGICGRKYRGYCNNVLYTYNHYYTCTILSGSARWIQSSMTCDYTDKKFSLLIATHVAMTYSANGWSVVVRCFSTEWRDAVASQFMTTVHGKYALHGIPQQPPKVILGLFMGCKAHNIGLDMLSLTQ
jgi:hypothetical protein